MIQSLFMFLLLVGALFVVFRVTGWKMKKAANSIIVDLKEAGALTPESAVALPYSREEFLRVGLRDYRPKALAALTTQHAVGMVEGGKYYLCKDIFTF
jgi:hypothetical protein